MHNSSHTNYAIDFHNFDTLDEQIGYMEFDSTGLGLVLARDTRNDVRNPDRGSYFLPVPSITKAVKPIPARWMRREFWITCCRMTRFSAETEV